MSTPSDYTLADLTPDEQDIIIHKGTEHPGTGEYLFEKRPGIFACRQCGSPLFRSDDKFDSGCGWPSFEEGIGQNIKETLDSDGRRMEITCTRCGGHIGHVFHGEQLTPKDTRHCANSLSLRFSAYEEQSGVYKRAVFAAGCFWGVEYYFRELPGVITVTSGYTGGHTEYPSYQQISTENTGHLEAVEVWYDPQIVSYQALVRYFFEIHDFSQENGQGPDIGEQYLSAIFVSTPSEQSIATGAISYLESQGLAVMTTIRDLERFYSAESYHQRYYDRTLRQPYCHRHVPIEWHT